LVAASLYLGLAAACQADARADALVGAREIENPPDYLGTVDGNGPCSTTYRTIGHEPDNRGVKHPLFLYLPGTKFARGTDYDAPPPLAVAEAMAERGFVALAVSYDNGIGAFLNSDKSAQRNCLFNPDEPAGLVATACSLENVDCQAHGIAVWGHSQGGALALAAANVAVSTSGTHLVRVAWLTGVGTSLDPSDLPDTRRRVVNGADDGGLFGGNNQPSTMTEITGAVQPDDCPGQPSNQCLRSDGSGWVLVSPVPGVIGSDHCWFQANGCGSDKTTAPGFIDPASTAPYALGPNADWVAATAATAW
jgi:hypothetical protein